MDDQNRSLPDSLNSQETHRELCLQSAWMWRRSAIREHKYGRQSMARICLMIAKELTYEAETGKQVHLVRRVGAMNREKRCGLPGCRLCQEADEQNRFT